MTDPDPKGGKDKDKDKGKPQLIRAPSGKEYTPAQIFQAMDNLVGQVQKLTEANEELTTKAAEGSKRPPKVPDPKEDDLESLGRKDFLDVVVNTVADRLVKPLQRQIEASEGLHDKERTADQISKVAEDNPDFWEFQGGIKKALEKYPEMNIEDAYLIARSKDPDTVARLEKAAQDEKDKLRAKEASEKADEFGGLLPTSGRRGSATEMEFEDAADAAWSDLDMKTHIAAVAGEN
jgi:hypothetical protein